MLVAALNGVFDPRPVASAAAALLALAVAVLAVAVLNEGLADATADAHHLVRWLARRFGPGASFGALYLEESGVPLPVFGDVLVVYLGHHFARWPAALVAVWLGLVLTTVGGGRLEQAAHRAYPTSSSSRST